MRILLVDDHAMFREAIAKLLAAEFQVDDCSTPAEALDALRTASYDLIVLDFDLGEEVATRLVPRIRQAGFTGGILVLSAFVNERAAYTLAAAGVQGITLKSHPANVLIEKIRSALRVEQCSDPQYIPAVTANGQDESSSSAWPDLSERERDTLRLLIRGQGNKDIASEFGVTEHAVKATLQRLFRKTGARTRSELVRIALSNYSHEL